MLCFFLNDMLILFQFFLDVSWHRDINGPFIVIPPKFNAAVEVAGPILGKGVCCFDACN